MPRANDKRQIPLPRTKKPTNRTDTFLPDYSDIFRVFNYNRTACARVRLEWVVVSRLNNKQQHRVIILHQNRLHFSRQEGYPPGAGLRAQSAEPLQPRPRCEPFLIPTVESCTASCTSVVGGDGGRKRIWSSAVLIACRSHGTRRSVD